MHNEIICTENGKIVAIQCVDNWKLKEIGEFMAIQEIFYPERDCRLKRKVKANGSKTLNKILYQTFTQTPKPCSLQKA